MIVYRVEYIVGDKTYGPYVASVHTGNTDVRNACNYFKNHSAMMREPNEDGIAILPHSHVVGCATIVDIFEWFARWSLERLLKAGFTLSQYEIPRDKVLVGGYQVGFNRKNAILIKHLTLAEALNIYQTSFDMEYE